jgi:hypothetical protein
MNAQTNDVLGKTLIAVIAKQREKEVKANIWAGSPWEGVSHLECNNVGIVGEQFVQQMCDLASIQANIDGATTKELGGGCGDGTIKGKTVEIKCARQSTGASQSFQHELGEKPWKAEFMLFFDISPSKFYITLFKNFTEQHYKSGEKCAPVIPTRKVCWRKKTGAFKLDTTVKINEIAAATAVPTTFAYNPSTSTPQEVGEFISRIIA